MKSLCYGVNFAILLIIVSVSQSQAFPSALVEYTVLSDSAKETGQLERYRNIATRRYSIELQGRTVEFEVPVSARAYDSVPIEYKILFRNEFDRWNYVEAVANENDSSISAKDIYDLNVPGSPDAKIEYLGSICADWQPEKYILMTTDPQTPVSEFPPYKRDEITRSGQIRPADLVWFKFRITNTGDTIIDPEGFSGSFAQPVIHKLKDDGTIEWTKLVSNHIIRQENYIYPGQSVEQWISFNCHQKNPPKKHFGLTAGKYRIDFGMRARFYHRYNWITNIWSGTEYAQTRFWLEVKDEPESTTIKSEKISLPADYTPTIFRKFEEFMSSFHTYAGTDLMASETSDTIYIQVAPWTKYITLKLVLTNPKAIKTIKVPIDVSHQTLDIEYNPENIMTVGEGDNQRPAVLAMPLPGMRSGIKLGPFPEKHMHDRLKEMKDLGINVLNNSSGDWWIHEMTGRNYPEAHSASYKYFYDVLVRQLDMKVSGWSIYPPTAPHWFKHASLLLGKDIKYSTAGKGYNDISVTVDLADPSVPEVIAAATKYNYQRWGDTWYKTKDGRVPIDIEDTWGWMRNDINIRYYLGPLGVKGFREYLERQYGNIIKLNYVWGSNFSSFTEIDPQANQGKAANNLKVMPEYNIDSHPFHDWNRAVEDWDRYRTILRMEIYKKANKLIRQFLPGAELCVRTEGANLLLKGEPDSDNMYWRHVYYSQRRNAMVYDILKDYDVVHFYSDYTTLPYPSHLWRKAMRQMVSDGFIPMFLPQFDHMRDILLNPHYGREYERHYNLKKPAKGMMIHCLMAAYPWWKATYEEGGAPGIIYSDFLCDGYATETQKHELKLLKSAFNNMKR